MKINLYSRSGVLIEVDLWDNCPETIISSYNPPCTRINVKNRIIFVLDEELDEYEPNLIQKIGSIPSCTRKVGLNRI